MGWRRSRSGGLIGLIQPPAEHAPLLVVSLDRAQSCIMHITYTASQIHICFRTAILSRPPFPDRPLARACIADVMH